MTAPDLWVAWFATAYAQTLPHAPDPNDDTTKRDTTVRRLGEPSPHMQGRKRMRRLGKAGVPYEQGSVFYRGRSGTWTAYMVRTVLAHDNTRDAELAHAASGVYTDKRLDFNWMFSKNYIRKVQ